MDLFAIPNGPVPDDAIISAVRTGDGLTLRVARWVAGRTCRGTIVVAIGRSEFIEEYFEVVRDLRARNFDVVIMDWRGQGQSDREIARPRRGHVVDFDAYRRDLDALEAQILRPFARRPWFGLGHSMGAAVLLDQAHAGLSPFVRLVLSAPMIDLSPRFRRTIATIIACAARLGFGEALIPGGDEGTIFRRGFAGNPLTSDPVRYARLAQATHSCSHLVVGAPTIAWTAAAFRLMDRFKRPRYAIETLMPTLIIAAGADRIVDTPSTERFAARLKTGYCITLPNARHEILMESDAIRDQFWAAFDAFIPGEAGPPIQGETSPPSRANLPASRSWQARVDA